LNNIAYVKIPVIIYKIKDGIEDGRGGIVFVFVVRIKDFEKIVDIVAFVMSISVLMPSVILPTVESVGFTSAMLHHFHGITMVATMMNRDKNTGGKDRINSQDQQGYYMMQSLFHHFAFIAREDKEKFRKL
jgi:hypothetical protein